MKNVMVNMATNIRSIGDVKRKFHGVKAFVDYMGGNANKRKKVGEGKSSAGPEEATP